MKVLVIPDVHLKFDMFCQARRLMNKGIADQAVCLMDIADDWHMQYDIDAYIKAYEAAIRFAKDFPETLWCYGNHDLCYLWNERESGYSPIAAYTACKMLNKLEETLSKSNNSIQYIHKIDNVLFLHGGLSENFVNSMVPKDKQNNPDEVIRIVNSLGHYELWDDESPIWYRPQSYRGALYKEKELLQVVGHTPVVDILRVGNLISCDTFSTYNNGKPIGIQKFLLIDTENWNFQGII